MAVEKSKALPIWYYSYQSNKRQKLQPSYGRAKAFLLEKLYLAITRHDLLDCYKLMRIVPRETSLDTYVLLRFILILINSAEPNSVNKNFLIYLESFLSKFELSKPDAFVEFIAYFIKNGRIEDARELFAQRQRSIQSRIHRPVPFIDLTICCYRFYINFHDWLLRCHSETVKFDYSIQGWLVNAMDSVKQVTSNYEYFVLAVMKVLLYYGFNKKAYLFASEFQSKNPDNISAQLIFLRFIDHLVRTQDDTKEDKKFNGLLNEEARIAARSNELLSVNNFRSEDVGEIFRINEYPLTTDKEQVLYNLKRLDPRRYEIIDLSAQVEHDQIARVQTIMDSLEYIEEIRSLARWESLRDIVNALLSTGNENLIDQLRTMWQDRYQRFWNIEHFLKHTRNEPDIQALIEKVLHLFNTKFNNSVDELYNVVDEDEDLIFDLN